MICRKFCLKQQRVNLFYFAESFVHTYFELGCSMRPRMSHDLGVLPLKPSCRLVTSQFQTEDISNFVQWYFIPPTYHTNYSIIHKNSLSCNLTRIYKFLRKIPSYTLKVTLTVPIHELSTGLDFNYHLDALLGHSTLQNPDFLVSLALI